MLVPALVEFAGSLSIAARRNHDLSAALVNCLHQLVSVICLVRDHGCRLMLREQFFSASHIVLLARTKAQFQRLSLGIYRDVQLGAESAARAPEGFPVGLFFSEAAPAAC